MRNCAHLWSCTIVCHCICIHLYILIPISVGGCSCSYVQLPVSYLCLWQHISVLVLNMCNGSSVSRYLSQSWCHLLYLPLLVSLNVSFYL